MCPDECGAGFFQGPAPVTPHPLRLRPPPLPAAQTFTDAQRETVIAAMKTATFRRGTYIVRQGEVGDRFYIILEVRLLRTP